MTKFPTLSARETRLKRLALWLMFLAIAIVAIAIMATVTYAQSADGWNGTGASGSWGGDTWIDYLGAAFMVAMQILVIIIARR